MKIIVAGMCKTGTKTMNAALTLLGYEVYDIMENYYYFGDDWIKIIRKGAKVKDLQRMYKDIDAVCDIPSCFYWEELLEAFPEAKVILTTRDEDSWFVSCKKQFDSLGAHFMLKMFYTVTYAGWKMVLVRNATYSLLGCRCRWPWSSINLYGEEPLKRLYRKHNRNVIQNAPKDQLLVYEVKQGWEPLCDFLGVDVPDCEFPHKNKGASVVDDMRKENKIVIRLQRDMYVSLALLFVLFALATFKLITWAKY